MPSVCPHYRWYLLMLCVCLSTAEDTCGGTFRGSSGSISSPDFQKDYQSSGECTWTILADPGDTISLVFTEFQMDSKLDSLEVEGSDPPTIWWESYWIVVVLWLLWLPDAAFCDRLLSVKLYNHPRPVISFISVIVSSFLCLSTASFFSHDLKKTIIHSFIHSTFDFMLLEKKIHCIL